MPQIKMTAVGTSDPIRLGLKNFQGGGVGLFLHISGTANAKVQVTGDPIELWPPTHWLDHDTLVNLTTSAGGNLAFPATGVRINVASITQPAGEVVLNAVQIDSSGGQI